MNQRKTGPLRQLKARNSRYETLAGQLLCWSLHELSARLCATVADVTVYCKTAQQQPPDTSLQLTACGCLSQQLFTACSPSGAAAMFCLGMLCGCGQAVSLCAVQHAVAGHAGSWWSLAAVRWVGVVLVCLFTEWVCATKCSEAVPLQVVPFSRVNALSGEYSNPVL
jgi:hypothetical protein